MSEDEYEIATDEQKLAIATYFIMSSPIGEADFVVADTQKLLGDDTKARDEEKILSEKVLRGILCEYNTEHMIRAKIPESKQMILFSPKAQLESGAAYLDPRGGIVYNVNHVSRTVTGQSDAKCAETDYDTIRRQIEEKVDGYLANKYKGGLCASAVYVSEGGNVTVCISASNTKISSYWTGGWNSTFSIDVSTPGEAVMNANVKLHVHYFEDGNVQLHSAISKEMKVIIGDDTAKNLVKSIDTVETNFQSSLEKMYVNIHRVTFKELRRFLPITKQPMEWSSYAHGVGMAK